MEKVYIKSQRTIYYDTVKNSFPMVAETDAKKISKANYSLLQSPYIEAFHCKNCKKMLIDLGN